MCISDANPYGGTVSFDNIFNSLEMAFVVMSSNTFSDIMYYTMDTDFMAASLFFIVGILVLSLWLMNLLVAVIASSFKLAREEVLLQRKEGGWTKYLQERLFPNSTHNHLDTLRRTKVGRIYWDLRSIWIMVILADLIVQCTLDEKSSQASINFIYRWQIWTTAALTFEILLRFLLYYPFSRDFFRSKGNVIDSFLALMNIIILLPPIHNNQLLYYWLTVFQISRFYRIAISIRFVRVLWARVLGNYKTIFNLTLFYLLTTFLCSLMAAQLLRGVIPFSDGDGIEEVSFYDLANSFIGMYVISTTENWTTMLYSATESASSNVAGACYAAFIILWFIFSNSIVLNMFVAVINENLELANKRKEQIKEFVKQYATRFDALSGAGRPGAKWVIRGPVRELIHRGKRAFSTANTGQNERETNQLESGEAVFNMLIDKKIVQGFLLEEEEGQYKDDVNDVDFQGFVDFFRKLYRFFVKKDKGKGKEENPFADASVITEADHTVDIVHAIVRNEQAKVDARKRYLQNNPRYDHSLYIFSPNNKIRQMCQKIVLPSVGTRSNGIYPNSVIGGTFWVLMLLATITLVTISCINTPIYFKQFTDKHGFTAHTWITYADVGFVAAFSLEAAIKIIADGFIFTPNAYTKSSWNDIDLIVLITIWITLISELFFGGYVSRYVRSFEAFRALRLLTVSASAQDTFHSVIIVGFGKIFGAALISLCLLFPFSVWGLNIFHGRLFYCTDDDVVNFSECVDEYLNSPFNWDIYTPRAITKPYYDYDSFGHAFLIQFEVISLEGWADVLNSLMSITGKDTNPINFSSRFNGVFPILYNIIGTIFIVTLFVSVIIKNYAVNRGTAYLTEQQLTWYEVQKVLKVVRPSLSAKRAIPGSLRYKLQRQIQHKSSWFNLIETFILGILVIALVIEYFPANRGQNIAITVLLVTCTAVYFIHYGIKVYAVGFRKFVRRRWNVYGVVVTSIAFVFTLIGTDENKSSTFTYTQKLGVVGMMLLWIPKSARLDQLFKTASSSFKEIANLLATWLVLFLAYAIAFNQVFGLTRIGPNGSGNINFRSVPKALILLFRMSLGEGWNQVLSDFLVSPPYCVEGTEFSNSDCGSHPFAYFLFLTWNILSMYIFLNMFISLIYDNFGYVHHHGSPHILKNDIKMFKSTWQKFDPKALGFIRLDQLHKFLHQCDGYFSMRVYNGKFTVQSILEDSRAIVNPNNLYDVDITALRSILRLIPYDQYREKRKAYELFCAEAEELAYQNPENPAEKLISFNSLLLQIPLYKTINYRDCFRLDDYLKRSMLLSRLELEQKRLRTYGMVKIVCERWKKLRRTAPTNPPNLAPIYTNPFTDTHSVTNVVPSIQVYEPISPEIPDRHTTPPPPPSQPTPFVNISNLDQSRGRFPVLSSSSSSSSALPHPTAKSMSPRRGGGTPRPPPDRSNDSDEEFNLE